MEEIINLEKVSFNDKKAIFQKFFTTGFLSISLNDKLVLISLIALTSYKLKSKNPTLTTLSLLLKITNQKEDSSAFYNFLESLSILVDDLSYGNSTFDSCGLSSSDEIIKKIKNLLSLWLPF